MSSKGVKVQMYKLDDQERLIIRELIRDPRISDNQIAVKTNVPLKTANRKRKLLEEKGLLHYFSYLDNTSEGTGTFQARSLYIIVLKEGITRIAMLEKYHNSHKVNTFFSKHINLSMLGEHEGNVALITLIESRKLDDLIEIYNAELVPELESFFGPGCIKKTMTLPITKFLRFNHNYLPGKNLKHGKLSEHWSNDNIFIDD